MLTLPPKLEREKLDSIVEAMRKSGGSKDELILVHLRLSYTIAVRMSIRFGYKDKQDLIDEAAYLVTEAVNEFFEPEVSYNNNITGYVITTLKHRLKDVIDKSRSVSMSARTIREKLKNGFNLTKELHPELAILVAEKLITEDNMMILSKLLPKDQPLFFEEAKTYTIKDFDSFIKTQIFNMLPIPKVGVIREDKDEEEMGDYFNLHKAKGGTYSYTIPEAKPIISQEFLEALQRSIHSPIEQFIIEMRKEGYGYKDIAEKSGLSKSKVGKIVNAVAERFDKIYY